jgi:hypothetical protein
MSDEQLKAAYQSRPAATTHVTETQWEQLACGELDAASRERALAHITSCAECREIHRSLLALATEAAQFDPNAMVVANPEPSASRTWMYVTGLAAAAAIFAAILLPNSRNTTIDDVTRSQAEGSAIGIRTPQSNARLDSRLFAWQPVANADAYEVIVNRADGGPIWTTRVSTAEVTVPDAITIGAGRYYWQVTALRQGAVVARSTLVPFRVE